MRVWTERPEEVKNLFNPAFCGRILYSTVSEYQNKANRDFPFVLIYLVLPLVLNASIRDVINSRTPLTNWVQNHQELLYDFGKRAADLVEITNEAVEFMIQTEYLYLTDNGELSISNIGPLSKTKFTDSEVKACITKAENVARWFAVTRRVETIFICLGVRP